MKKIFNILNSNFILLFLVPALLSLFLLFNKPAYQQQYPASYDLQVMPLVLQYVDRYYVDEKKVNPNEMLLEGLNKIESLLDQVLVEFKEPKNTSNFTVRVNDNIKQYENVEIYDMDDLKDIMQDVFAFVLPMINNNEIKTIDIEYAVTDKILKTLDQHSGIITPEVYKEFMIETEGSFGGLGIVIGIRDGDLTVISPIEGTPAYKAGIEPNDKIIQIENESTVNMSLIEAVSKLRGKKGTLVNIHVMRESFDIPKKFEILRDTIKIESVEDYELDNNILYLRIRDFQKNTFSSLINTIEKREPELEGLILDLRGNPGGLLDQAEKISDFFLTDGTVVTTKVGNTKKRYRAKFSPPEFEGEVVVLVDSGSASASEIVAGALKNNERAIVIGQKTFGKGSVQQIFDLKNGSALKLTIADYLTPGDISIQDVGITPDIEIEPAIISQDKVVYNASGYKSADEESSNSKQTPTYRIKYLFDDPGKNEETPEEALSKGEKKKRIEKDFAVLLAKEIISSSEDLDRTLVLSKSQEIISRSTDEEENKIELKWKEIGVDWSKEESDLNNPQLSVKVLPNERKFNVGKKQSITVLVKNLSDKNLYRLMAITESDNPVFDGKELILGKLSPQETKRWTASFDIPKWVSTRNDEVKLNFKHSSETALEDFLFNVTTVGNNKPAYAFNYEIVDDGRYNSAGNGDGKPQIGETVSVAFKIKNIGDGESEKTIVALKNLSGEKIFLEQGRFEFTNFKPKAIKTAPFVFKINKEIKNIEFDLNIIDEVFREVVKRKIDVGSTDSKSNFKKSESFAIVLEDDTSVKGGGFSNAPVIGYSKKNSSYKTIGYNDSFVKAFINNDIIGWFDKDKILLSDFNKTDNGENNFSEVFLTPPKINLLNTPLITRDGEITLSGSVVDSDNIENISLFSGEDKIKLLTPESNNQSFSFKVKLENGINVFNIIAKDSTGLYTKETVTVRKADLS